MELNLLTPLWRAALYAAGHARQLGCPVESPIMLLILMAAKGVTHAPDGREWFPQLGGNARITKDRQIISRMIDWDGHRDRRVDLGEQLVCTVDDLNRGLGWLMKELNASDAEYNEIVMRVRSWIARDENELAKHIEAQREALTVDAKLDLTDLLKEDAEREKRKKEKLQ